ncbi:hypothetical protein C8F04DRAFT_971139 [Mycena alexandri]|uniref:Uncharacterized protein n=1 Tax=Mycena alexandri TaxID=1745969 RepID=A0AAD6WRV7_9AGAR|nr:hypothetical protein C8F04DRAFT_971139 [Mycena alexandri]
MSNSSWRNTNPGRGTGRLRGTHTKTQLAESGPRRKMELIASVSRSGGLEKDGDALKDFEVQAEYREFVQGKLDDLLQKYPRHHAESETQSRQRIDAQENVLLLFRELLREGIISSKRIGSFTLEVYETSLYLAILFDSPRHIGPVIPALMSYFNLPSTEPHNHCAQTVVISLLYHLVAAYPSQREFHSNVGSIPKAFFPDDCGARLWITSLARCIRARNYAQINQFTALSALPADNGVLPTEGNRNSDLSRKALYHLVDLLRGKTREMAWTVMRTAYRELSCQMEPKLDTRGWLEHSLGLLSDIPGGCSINLDHWLERECTLGHVRRKEGTEGRWIVCKPR